MKTIVHTHKYSIYILFTYIYIYIIYNYVNTHNIYLTARPTVPNFCSNVLVFGPAAQAFLEDQNVTCRSSSG